MNQVLELTEDILQTIVADNNKVAVQFGATWCGACKVMKPKFKKAAESNEDITFVYVDVEQLQESRSITVIKNLPTFAGFSNGELVSKQVGSKADTVTNLINEINK